MKKLVLIFAAAIIFSCKGKTEEQQNTIDNVITDHPTKKIETIEEYCFLKVSGKDSIILNFKKQGDSIWGNYDNLHYGIDKRRSRFSGRINGKDARTISNYSAEGDNYTEELLFTVEDDKARLNYGVTEQDEKGIWRYKKGEPLQERILPKVPCKN